MSYISKVALYTDQDPVSKRWNGQILEAGDAAAKFLLVGAGCVLNDEDARKFGVANHKSLTPYDPIQAAAAREHAVLQRSAELADSRSRVGQASHPGPVDTKTIKKSRAKKPLK